MNIRFLSLIVFATMAVTVSAQTRFLTKTGHIEFFSHTSVEDIKADNEQVSGIIDITTGEMVFQVLNRSFQFPKPLMQEHFNENYMESEKFPKSVFEGKVTDLKMVNFTKPGKYPVKVSGKLTIHGVTRDLETSGTLSVDNGKLTGESVFEVKPEDYGIKIPAVVRQNIAETVKISVLMNYLPYNPKK